MNFFTKLRLNIKEYGKQVLIIVAVFAGLIFIAKLVSTLFESSPYMAKPIINKNSQKAVVKESKSPNNKTHSKVESIIDKFIKACNEFNFEKAYTYISSTNKEYFGSYKAFENYMKKTFNEQKRYELKAYSKVEDIDIYQLKLFSDFLATGLTKQEFNYLDLKIAAKLDKDEPNGIMLNLEGYIKTEDLKDMLENDDLRIDIKKSKILYKSEILELDIQNKTSEYLILKDGNSERPEITTTVGKEERPDLRKDKIVLSSYEKRKVYIEFFKFADDGKKIKKLDFNDIRFSKEYKQSGEENKYTKRYTSKMEVRTKTK